MSRFSRTATRYTAWDPDGKVRVRQPICGKCNGVLIPPDQKTMYIIGNGQRLVRIPEPEGRRKDPARASSTAGYDVAADGSLSTRRVVIDYTARDKPCSGPDGMIADAEGNIWLASRCEYRPGIQVLDPKGKELAIFPPVRSCPPTSLRARRRFEPAVSLTLGQEPVQDPGAKKGYQLP